jgi:hypothetical protein
VSNSALLVPRSFPHFSTIAEGMFVEHRSLLTVDWTDDRREVHDCQSPSMHPHAAP